MHHRHKATKIALPHEIAINKNKAKHNPFPCRLHISNTCTPKLEKKGWWENSSKRMHYRLKGSSGYRFFSYIFDESGDEWRGGGEQTLKARVTKNSKILFFFFSFFKVVTKFFPVFRRPR